MRVTGLKAELAAEQVRETPRPAPLIFPLAVSFVCFLGQHERDRNDMTIWQDTLETHRRLF